MGETGQERLKHPVDSTIGDQILGGMDPSTLTTEYGLSEGTADSLYARTLAAAGTLPSEVVTSMINDSTEQDDAGSALPKPDIAESLNGQLNEIPGKSVVDAAIGSVLEVSSEDVWGKIAAAVGDARTAK